MLRLRFVSCVFALLSLLPLAAYAGLDSATVRLDKDSQRKELRYWRYHGGDDLSWAAPTFNDGAWPLQKSHVKASSFPGIGWWRSTLEVDSAMASKPVGFMLDHEGASHIFLDGRLIAELGDIDSQGRLKAAYSTGERPFLINISEGRHVLAVRHAQEPTGTWMLRPRLDDKGFFLEVAEGDQTLANKWGNALTYGGISFFLFGLFLAFGLLHLILYLYYKAESSHAWFALFSICLSVIFLLLFTNNSGSTTMEEFYDFALPIVVLLGCFALVRFIHSIFNKQRRWIEYFLLLLIPFTFIEDSITSYTVITGLLGASIETITTIIISIVKRRPGARIIGAGLILFTLLIIVFFMGTILLGNVSFQGTAAAILLAIIFIAIMSIPLSMSAYLAWNFATMNKTLKANLSEVERLSTEARRHEAEKQRMLETRKEELEQEVAVRTDELLKQKKKSDDLLLNILPAEVAEELKEKGQSTARQYDNVTVVFTDFVDFTQHSEHLSPEALVAEIDECFGAFDGIITKYGLEKIKTVGDAYIAVSGLPAANEHHARDVVMAAREIMTYMEKWVGRDGKGFGIRIGVHSGPVVAGIVGVKKFAYDIWGDTVNTAARMEQHGEAGRINISDATYTLIKDQFECSYRGELDVKHKGRMHMYFVESVKAIPAGT